MQLGIGIPGLALGVAAALALGAAGPAAAQTKTKSTQTEARWVEFDAEAKTVTVKVVKPGRGKNARKLKRGREATFAVKPEGSVLTRTTVAINGQKADLTDIAPGKTVNVYWVPDEKDEQGKFARKIDVIMSEEEFNERYGIED